MLSVSRMIPLSSPGLFDSVSHTDYHLDPCLSPSLSSHVAMVLIGRSPAHARLVHPRLGGQVSSESTDEAVRGSVLHGMLLGGGQEVVTVGADSWRTKAAQTARDDIEAGGKIAMLARKYEALVGAADQIRKVIPFNLIEARKETTAIWQSAGVWCRARIDAILGLDIYDLKTTEDAAAASEGRAIAAHGYHIQAAANVEALSTLADGGAGRVRFFDVFAEVAPPFGVIVVEIAGSLLDLGRRQWNRAKRTWYQCLESGVWPAYSTTVKRVEAPAWMLEAEIGNELATGGPPPF